MSTNSFHQLDHSIDTSYDGKSTYNKWIIDVMLILETWLDAIAYYIEINTLNISLNVIQDKDPLILATLCLVLDVLFFSKEEYTPLVKMTYNIYL